jgi:DNA-binding CsgD family transcriptional regulator
VTSREVECLVALAHYGPQQETAAFLGISERTLNNTLYNLRQKLGVRTNLQAYNRLAVGLTIGGLSLKLEIE